MRMSPEMSAFAREYGREIGQWMTRLGALAAMHGAPKDRIVKLIHDMTERLDTFSRPDRFCSGVDEDDYVDLDAFNWDNEGSENNSQGDTPGKI